MRIALSLLISTALLEPSPVSATDVIRFSPGPNGSTAITTPWGSFVAVQNGDEIWVGTERDWTNIIADNVARHSGEMHVRLAGTSPNTRAYVSAADPVVTLGGGKLYDIESSIVFGVRPNKALGRPPKPKASEYVDVVWVPQLRNLASVRILIDGKAYVPNECGTDQEFRHCEFTIPRPALTRPATELFLLRGAVPAALWMRSLAWRARTDLVNKYLKDHDAPPISDEDKSDLANFHALDISLSPDLEP